MKGYKGITVKRIIVITGLIIAFVPLLAIPAYADVNNNPLLAIYQNGTWINQGNITATTVSWTPNGGNYASYEPRGYLIDYSINNISDVRYRIRYVYTTNNINYNGENLITFNISLLTVYSQNGIEPEIVPSAVAGNIILEASVLIDGQYSIIPVNPIGEPVGVRQYGEIQGYFLGTGGQPKLKVICNTYTVSYDLSDVEGDIQNFGIIFNMSRITNNITLDNNMIFQTYAMFTVNPMVSNDNTTIEGDWKDYFSDLINEAELKDKAEQAQQAGQQAQDALNNSNVVSGETKDILNTFSGIFNVSFISSMITMLGIILILCWGIHKGNS